jgi:hypothetical protein
VFASFNNESFSGIGYHIGGVADVPVATKTGILLKAGYESKHLSGLVTEGSQSLSTSATLNYIELAGMVRHDLSENVSINGGMALQLGLGGGYSQTIQSGGTSHSEGDADAKLSVPTQVALTVGASYRIPVSATMDLVPSASFNLFLTSPTPLGDDHAHTLTLGARLMFR